MTSASTDTAELARTVDLAGSAVVDVGCGAGALVRWLRSRGADAVGVECGPVMRARALAADPGHPEAYLDGVGEDLPLGDASMDLVCFLRSLHHVPVAAMGDALREARRVLRPGGLVHVVEPVAAGPGFELARLVDDETEVRAAARAALAEAPGLGLDVERSWSYTTRSVHGGLDDWLDGMVGVDPGRATAAERHRDELARAFATAGVAVEGGRAFDQEQWVLQLRRTR